MPLISNYNSQTLLASEETKKYLSDMWNKDYGQGLYFSALHEIDEHMYVPIFIGSQWFYAAHALFDGFSILNYLNKTFPTLKLTHQLNTPFLPPKGVHWIKALRFALSSKPTEKHQFIKQLPYDTALNQKISYFHIQFTKNETTQLSKTNLTSVALKKISTFFMKKLSYNKASRWMIPVNIRGPVKSAKLAQMDASYIGVNCSIDSTPELIKNELVKKLKAGEQWGYWLMGNIGLLGGRKFIINQTIKSLNKKNSLWFGSLSNLGNIGGDETSPELIIIAPVRWHRPIGCALYVYKNKLNLIMCFHQSLDLDEKVLEDYKNEIYQSLIST